ncbi:MAG: LPS translocon maturation chaperone LptM [Gammaproteobacteria bacterium]
MSFQRSSPAILAALTLLLAGCGQRGPLYFPDQHPSKKRLSQPAPGVANDTSAVLRGVGPS